MTFNEANDLVVRANDLVVEHDLPPTSGPFRDVVRSTLALMRGDYTDAADLAKGVIGFLTPREQ